MRQKIFASVQAGCLLLTALSILVGFGHFAGHRTLPISRLSSSVGHNSAQTKGEKPINTSVVDHSPSLKDGNSTLLKAAPAYINAIMTPEDKSFPRLDCLPPLRDRYEYLRKNSTNTSADNTRPSYFFALDLHQCAHVLPRLMGSIIESIRFLGPSNCVLSIVEGRSEDGTFEILKSLRGEIEAIGAKYFFSSSDLKPAGNDRIGAGINRIVVLAELRNLALEPMTKRPDKFSEDTTVIFLNDVSICMDDILELIHQRIYQNAEMTCAMDWTYVGPEPTFYDVWVSRGMTGDTFFHIPKGGSWGSARNLFWNDPETLARYNTHKPFQVFSCWNGATAFTAKPLLEQKIRFRAKVGDECFQGEPQLFCRDLWHLGYRRIAVIPAVNLEYSDEKAQKIKALKGYVSQWVNKDGVSDESSDRIEWKTNPPPLIICKSTLGNQTWLPWDYQSALMLPDVDSATKK